MSTSQIVLVALSLALSIMAFVDARACRRYRIRSEAAADRAEAAYQQSKALAEETRALTGQAPLTQHLGDREFVGEVSARTRPRGRI